MNLTYEQKQKEIIYCMIEQGYFILNNYKKEIKKIEERKDIPSFIKDIEISLLHNIMFEVIDEILKQEKEL